jgi:plasmid maintenance system antidote protein VapI
MKSFVEILRDRIASDPNLTDAGLAVKAGLDNSTIRQMIANNRSPRIDTAVKICAALGETVESFMAQSRDPAVSELLFHLEQLTPAERDLLLAAARGLRARHPEAAPLSLAAPPRALPSRSEAHPPDVEVQS